MNKPIKIPFGVNVYFGNTVFHEILERYGVAGWNAWIDAINKQNLVYPSYDIRFNGPSFQVEFILKDIDLSNRQLNYLDLTMVYLSHGVLCHSSFRGAKFLITRYCNFNKCDLRNSFFNSCDVSESIFTDTNIDEVKWERAYFYTGHFPIGLPESVMARLQQLEPDNAAVAEPKKIGCMAEIQDASYFVSTEQRQPSQKQI